MRNYRSFSIAVRIVACAALLTSTMPALRAPAQTPVPASEVKNKPTPALDAFMKAWDGIDNYHETIVTHETTDDGKSIQDRTYDYKFKKPTYALILITDGPGKGGGAAWHGGDKVKGHQGGILSHLKLIVPITDPRATSLRGDTMVVASFQYEINHYLTTPGTVSEAPGPSVDGKPTTAVTLNVSDPKSNGNVSKDVLDIDNATHLTAKREQYVGSTLVKTETFKDIQLNPGLKPEDFDIV